MISKEKTDLNKWAYHYSDIMKKWDDNEITEEEIRQLNEKDMIDPVSVTELIFEGPLADDILHCTGHGTIEEVKARIDRIKLNAQVRRKHK